MFNVDCYQTYQTVFPEFSEYLDLSLFLKRRYTNKCVILIIIIIIIIQ